MHLRKTPEQLTWNQLFDRGVGEYIRIIKRMRVLQKCVDRVWLWPSTDSESVIRSDERSKKEVHPIHEDASTLERSVAVLRSTGRTVFCSFGAQSWLTDYDSLERCGSVVAFRLSGLNPKCGPMFARLRA